jgi:hypothetical protein
MEARHMIFKGEEFLKVNKSTPSPYSDKLEEPVMK